ncbi:flagellin [Haloplanus rubicundus]|uniref:Flagellin n=1 Tax=Haloplanus rubicundus TaxID=1547898 RepID=A0A345E3S8_9EURY|nr:archaellin/type IV pilin N-terminal domain-containing protein [Haloplanus rubicundus]AXG06850.1 flagellin [Haloplanus rubicundus]AXG10224.1 flagellin [Haloplanus rubicundus]
MFEERTERGQVGIGTLIVFIAMVLVAAIAAGVLINTAGFLQTQSEQTGQQSSAQVTDRLEPVSKTGNVSAYDYNNNSIRGSVAVNNDTSLAVDNVSMVVQKSPGASDINMSATTFELIGPDGTDRFAFTNGTAINKTRGDVRSLQDDDNSLNTTRDAGLILNSRTDRLVVTINMTALDQNGAYDNDPLEPGETLTLRVNTESGATSIIRIQVPQSLNGEKSVEL